MHSKLTEDLLAALDLPTSARVDQRVPKKLLVENGAPTAADKRQINEGIEELRWLATLKPTTMGVPDYRDDAREYLEITVLLLVLRPNGKVKRLNELVHRAVPYPVYLVTEQAPRLAVSLAHKRWSHGEVDKTVLDGELIEGRLDDESPSDIVQAFLGALALARQPRTTLHALYQGWIDTLLTLQAAQLTGAFAQPKSGAQATARRNALRACADIESRMAALRTVAKKEKQIARQVELNLELKRLQADYSAAREKL
jgi:hypothetical protein